MLIVFAKYPAAGQAKTRLIPAVGPIEAADLQHRMTLRTLATARQFSRETGIDIEARSTGATAEQMEGLYGDDLRYRDQGEGDLGRRLHTAIAEGFGNGARTVVVVGTDCPALTTQHLWTAQRALTTTDLVVGPAVDGGYYLIGLRQPRKELFEGIMWSSERVLEQTLDIAGRLGLSTQLLELLADIDRPEDLQHLPPL